MIIGFTGTIGSGKTTAATYLLQHGFDRVRFAGPLKDMLRIIGLNSQDLDGATKEEPHPLLCGKTPRHAMQTLGTEWGRNIIGPDFWIEQWRRRVQLSSAEDIVADDLRFGNEAEAIKMLGGTTVRLYRDTGEIQHHASEVIAFNTDYYIDNNGSLQDLEKAVNELVVHLSEHLGKASESPAR